MNPTFLGSMITALTILVGCTSHQAPAPPHTHATEIPETPPVPQAPKRTAPATSVTAETNEGPKHPLIARTITTRGIQLTVVTFDRRDHDLVVDDQPGGPGSKYNGAQDAGRGHLAAINAGFFTPEGNPLGLVITQGQKRGSINRSSFLGTGFFLGPKAQLVSRTDFLGHPLKTSEALQSGPRLLWAGETLTGLSNKDQRPRSFLLWDGHNHFALGHADSASLKGLSEALQGQPITAFKIAYALNLDGGRSCDLWLSSSVSGGGFSRTSFFNKDVRNYLVLKAR